MARQTFFVGARCLGSRDIPASTFTPGLGLRAIRSRAYFCGQCGDIWGRLLVDTAKFTELTQRPCLAHGDGRFSQFHNFDEGTDFAADWPPAATAHEARAWLGYARNFSPSSDHPLTPYMEAFSAT